MVPNGSAARGRKPHRLEFGWPEETKKSGDFLAGKSPLKVPEDFPNENLHWLVVWNMTG